MTPIGVAPAEATGREEIIRVFAGVLVVERGIGLDE